LLFAFCFSESAVCTQSAEHVCLLPSAFCFLTMARSHPPDVLVLDGNSLIHARIGRGRRALQIVQAKSYRLPADAIVPSVVTPQIGNEAAIAEVLRRLRLETGRWDKASLLLPDSWFRINIIELQALPDNPNEAQEILRWSLKRTMPVDAAALRLAWEVISRGAQVKVLVVSAVEKTLVDLERLFHAAGIDLTLIEPLGLNIWNTIAVREPATTRDRLFFYFREADFTTAVFRGTQPLFIRSRNLNAERPLAQEIKLSASYIRDTLQSGNVENCYLAGNRIDPEVAAAIAGEFKAPVRTLELSDVTERTPIGVEAYEAELAGCTGVFA
jgi:Tfp pilus assembly PilM family ATPase